MNELREIIRREIEACGAMSFARFMELSLYCPEFGYYERLANRPGRHGDFYTSVSVGSLFGELLAFQFASWIDEAGLERFQLLEAGAHDGRLAQDVLNWFQSRRPDLLEKLEYWILEPSLRRRQWQERTLNQFASRIRWFDSWETLLRRGVWGVIFSNELLDAMPVRRVGWDARERKWFEWGVAMEDGGFVWKRMPAGSSSNVFTPRSPFPVAHLTELPADLLAVLPDGFTTEVSPAVAAWWRQAAASLKKGRLLTFDYGLTAEQFFVPDRFQGTLRAYRRHGLHADLLAHAGEQDLTAHVNFTVLKATGASAGLGTEGLFSQAEFLTRVAEATWRDGSSFGEWTTARAREFQTLTHAEHLGRAFKVLVQTR